jgi:hypothetical protein
MSFHPCICHQTPCICGSDQEAPRMAFTPETFSLLLDGARQWFGLFVRLADGRQSGREHYGEAITVLLRDRARQLRN